MDGKGQATPVPVAETSGPKELRAVVSLNPFVVVGD
jgi:hypothetical protein